VKNATGRYVITYSTMVSLCEAPEYYHLKNTTEIYNAYVTAQHDTTRGSVAHTLGPILMI